MNHPPEDHETAPPMPRWVKVFGIIALVLVVILVIALLVGGDHGPGRHSGIAPVNGLAAIVGAGGRRP